MAKFYFILNAVIYLLFSVWCMIRPGETAKSLGYETLSNSGKAEYAAVYVGMELGLCAFFAICAFNPSMLRPGLIFATCFYLGLMIARTISVLLLDNVSKMTFVAGGMEYILGIGAALLLWMELKK